MMEEKMKTWFFAALAALAVSVAAVPSFAASTIADDRGATLMQQTGAYGNGG
jgi:hypothetical protein